MYNERGEFRWLQFLIGVNGFIFLAYLFLGSENIIDEVLLYGVFNAFGVQNGMFWLLITSTFAHFDPFHFLLNIIALFQIGLLVEKLYSSKKLFITYIIGGLVGSLFTLLLAVVADTNIASLGASGAVFALLGLLIGGTYKQNRYGVSLPFTKESFYPTLFFALIISFFPGINWAAHLGGFISGFLLGYVFENSMIPVINPRDKMLESRLFLASMFLFAFSYILLIFNIIFEIVPTS